MFRALARAFMINRMVRGSRGRRYGGRYGYGSRGRGGFFGPMPYYTRRTRGGSRVSVSGCCLPIPLSLAMMLAFGFGALLRR
jgi:hypothetical protein